MTNITFTNEKCSTWRFLSQDSRWVSQDIYLLNLKARQPQILTLSITDSNPKHIHSMEVSDLRNIDQYTHLYAKG